MRALSWRTRLELALASPAALRVMDRASIVGVAQAVRPGLSEAAIERWVHEAVGARRLQRVVRGLYLNQLISPPAQLCEAAVWLRPGAVVSLQTVLGDCGAWNNYTDWVTAVVPLSQRYTVPSLGRLETAAGTFVFRGMRESVLEAGEEQDRLDVSKPYRRATPEAALLHWLYLSNSPRSDMSEPPLDLEVESLDARKLQRLARTMGIDGPLQAVLTRRGMTPARAARARSDRPATKMRRPL